MLGKISDGIVRVVKSPRFFYAVVALLVLQAGWIALTARYPQAFDENYHLGLIQLHAAQWLPFFTKQPPDSLVYGALGRDPSYLYHFLLSIPYRLLIHITSSQVAQVIVLRFFNIAFFVAGLFVYRKLFDEMRIAPALRNIALLVLVLLPMVPLLAGQINYDNLMFLAAGLLFLYVARSIYYLRSRLPSQPLVPLDLCLLILLVGSLGSIVTFPFAPLFLAAVVIVIIALIFYYRLSRYTPTLVRLPGSKATRAGLVVLAICTALALGLCFERYGINMIKYHSPVPDCNQVLDIDDCMQYSPWARNYTYARVYPRPKPLGYIVYTPVWINRMVSETMFTITSYFNDGGTVTYAARSPLVVAHITSWVALGVGSMGAVLFWRRIRLNRYLTTLFGIALFYTIVLFLQNFLDYHKTGEVVAVHGRYLVPVVPVFLVCLVMGWQSLLRRVQRGRYEALVLLVITLFFLQGGGITNWLVRSDDTWYWQQNPTASGANHAAKAVVDHVVYH